jgi:hypothetical protein
MSISIWIKIWNSFLSDCTDFSSDIVFVTDASGSVKTANYQKIKAFVLTLINAFNVSQDETRIGHVDYSYGINSYFYLDMFDNNFEVSLEITNLV